MNLYLVILIAFALAMDAFAVSIGVSLLPGGLKAGQSLRLALSFGLFQFLMPLVGWLAAQEIHHIIRNVDHWAAFGLLLLVGGKMVTGSFRKRDGEKTTARDPTTGLTLIGLSIATSIDAFAVGLGFSAIQQRILWPSIIIGLVAFAMTFVGTKVGPVFGRIAGKRAEMAGGLILILIGIKVLIDHF
jgi:putative Mn2+ efflux pump MntP